MGRISTVRSILGKGGLALLALGMALFAVFPARAETLAQAVAAALNSNPQLLAAQAQLSATRQTLIQAQAGYLPTVTFDAIRSDDKDLRRDSFDVTSVSTIGFTLNQPILSGGRVPANVAIARVNIAAAEERVRQLEGELIRAVIIAYSDVRRDRQAVRIQHENLEALALRLEEVRARQRDLDLTLTDVGLAQARLAGAQSDLAQLQARLAGNEAAYLALVGAPPGDLEAPPPLLGLPAGASGALTIALDMSPALGAAEEDRREAEARVRRARADPAPTLDLRLTLGRSWTEIPPFPVREDAEARALLVFRAPLWATYQQGSSLRVARENVLIADLALEGVRREILSAVGRAMSEIAAADAAIRAAEEGVVAARVAAEGIIEEARIGSRTTYDVLAQQTELRNAEFALHAAERNAYVARAELLNAMGVLTAASVPPGPVRIAAAEPAPVAAEADAPVNAKAEPRPTRRAAARATPSKPKGLGLRGRQSRKGV